MSAVQVQCYQRKVHFYISTNLCNSECIFHNAPSITFVVDIPESSNDLFYQGKAYVCLKDKVTRPPSPLRHSMDKLASCLSTIVTMVWFPQILFLLSVMADPISLSLDMLVVGRTCPYQSMQNIAERIVNIKSSINESFSCEGASSSTSATDTQQEDYG